MDAGKLFLPAIFFIVAIYLFVTQTDFNVQWFGGGILFVLGVLTLYGAYQKDKKAETPAAPKPEAAPEAK